MKFQSQDFRVGGLQFPFYCSVFRCLLLVKLIIVLIVDKILKRKTKEIKLKKFRFYHCYKRNCIIGIDFIIGKKGIVYSKLII